MKGNQDYIHSCDNIDMDVQKCFSGCLMGLVVGEAVGTTVEFGERCKFPPVTDMVGRRPFDLKPGAWTDDTSMALYLAENLVAMNGFDVLDQMERYWKCIRMAV